MFDDDDEMLDPDFQAELAEVEQRALAANSQQSQSQTRNVAQGRTAHPHTASTSTRPIVIDIDDGSDKENTSMSQRRMRRTNAHNARRHRSELSMDVIEISD